jgi:hypothetical protein
LATVLACVGCATSSREHPISVCDVLDAPASYDGQRVLIRGVVDTDYFEFSGLADAMCNQKVISFGPENRVRSGLAELLSATQAVRDTPSQRVEVTVDGVIAYRPGQVPFLVIDEMSFSDLEVVPWDQEGAH